MFAKESWRVLFTRRMFWCVLTGLASGMPYFVLVSLLPAWLRTNSIDLKTIGLFALVQFPYTWKFLWSPFLDRFSVPVLGFRRGWILVTQVLIIGVTAGLGLFDPHTSLQNIVLLAVLLAFFSATADIVIDAFRREFLSDEELDLGNSIHVSAWRLSGLIPASLGLILADFLPWSTTFAIISAFMAVGVLLTFIAPEPERVAAPPKTLRESVVEPFKEFFARKGASAAWLILAFLVLYKIGDNMATALATPFYLDMGYSMTQIGIVAKQAALWPMIVGGLLGGLWMLKLGINRSLWIFGVVQMISILGFAALSALTPEQRNLWWLGGVIAFEYLGVGLGAAATTALIARLADRRFVATQIALLTALAVVPRVFANASTGFIVESIGWVNFYLLCTVMAIPGMVLLLWVAPWRQKTE